MAVAPAKAAAPVYEAHLFIARDSAGPLPGTSEEGAGAVPLSRALVAAPSLFLGYS
jgi:hypothetical protein